MPGIASCFTRIWGIAKLWMTSRLDRYTMTGSSTGRLSWLMVATSSAPAGSLRSRPVALVGVIRLASRRPNMPSGPG